MADFRMIVRQAGGADVIEREPIDAVSLVPGQGEVRLRQRAVGLNFIDTYQRSGLYKVALPSGLGAEGAGIIDATGGRR